jgi:hypothetical protein
MHVIEILLTLSLVAVSAEPFLKPDFSMLVSELFLSRLNSSLKQTKCLILHVLFKQQTHTLETFLC